MQYTYAEYQKLVVAAYEGTKDSPEAKQNVPEKQRNNPRFNGHPAYLMARDLRDAAFPDGDI